jgi:hypothetical protein
MCVCVLNVKGGGAVEGEGQQGCNERYVRENS